MSTSENTDIFKAVFFQTNAFTYGNSVEYLILEFKKAETDFNFSPVILASDLKQTQLIKRC
jgi:hypothetical protein